MARATPASISACSRELKAVHGFAVTELPKLTSEHRAELRASIAAAAPQSSQEDGDREYQQAMEAWRARDAHRRAEADRLDQARAVAVWGLVPAAATLPSVAAAAIYGWGLGGLLTSLLEASWLPLALLGGRGGVKRAGWCRPVRLPGEQGGPSG